MSILTEVEEAARQEDAFFHRINAQVRVEREDLAPVYIGEIPAWVIRSRMTPGVVYQVQRFESGYVCSCPARKLCWHIGAVLGGLR